MCGQLSQTQALVNYTWHCIQCDLFTNQIHLTHSTDILYLCHDDFNHIVYCMWCGDVLLLESNWQHNDTLQKLSLKHVSDVTVFKKDATLKTGNIYS